MTKPSEWFSLGPLIIRETCLPTVGGSELEVDLAITTSGWESRNLAIIDALSVKAKNGIVLDFAVVPELQQCAQDQAHKLKKHLRCAALKLQSSVHVDRNIHAIKTSIRSQLPNGLNTLFVDITAIPRGYFQSLVGWLLMEGLVGQIHVGYCEGLYGESFVGTPVEEGVARFAPVKPLIGATGPCREKRLIVVLGKEKSSCYGLIEEMAPDYIHVLATENLNYPEMFDAVQAQIDRLQAVYAEQVVQIARVDSFSMRALCDSIDCASIQDRRDVATTIFAAGTKPHALAASLLGVAFKDRIEVRYRQKAAYDPREVEIGRHYRMYTIVDLRSGRLAGCDVW